MRTVTERMGWVAGGRGRTTVAVLIGVAVVAAALGLGVAGGYLYARMGSGVPDLAAMLGPVTSDPVAAALFAGALAVLIVPFGTYIVYQLFFLTER
jgi:hypothetical protein